MSGTVGRIGLAAGIVLGGLLNPANAEEYRLGPQDKVRIRVLEWLPTRGAYQKWDALDGDYVVSGAGGISIPLVGTVHASGRSPEALAEAIGLAVQKRTELRAPLEVSVEIAQYRPLYVMGAVKTPGEYPWRPDLDVTKAIGVAGGRYRPFEGSARLERDVISQAGLIEGLRLEMTRTLARRARLEAEAGERDEIEFSPELLGDPAHVAILREERTILASRRGALTRQLGAIDELKVFLATEIDSLQSKVAVQDRQMDSARKELSSVAGLASRGLSPANRQFAMDRVLAGLESERLDLSTAIIRVRQNLANADRDKITLVEERQLQIARDAQEAQAALEQLRAKLATAERLIYEAGITAPRALADAMVHRDFDVTYTITRREGGSVVVVQADRNTLVQPGDIVDVTEITPTGMLADADAVAGRQPVEPAALLAAFGVTSLLGAPHGPAPTPRGHRGEVSHARH